jgi:hypothetical protein
MKKTIISLAGLHRLILILGIIAMLSAASTRAVYAKEELKQPYLIKVNRACNTITVYEKDNEGKYSVPVKAMVCSVGKGTRTITGTFNTKEKYRWKLLMGDVWGQYATRIVGGILFHSVYYYGYCDPATLATKEYNKLGTAASHGCIRLTVADAKWIYDNCPAGTSVVIYDDIKNPGPLGKPEAIKLPSSVRWDPTDTNENNPFKNKLPKISGAKNISVDYGNTIDLLSGIKAVSSLGDDITTKLRIEGDIDYGKPGKYKITYSVTDNLNREYKKTITVTVKTPIVPSYTSPELKGVTNRVVNTDVTKELVLSGVEAYYSELSLDKNNIDVQIEEVNKDEYYITYQLSYDGKITTEHASFYVDREAPAINGVRDFTLEAGEIPSEGYLLDRISVSDNYSSSKSIIISTALVENSDGSYKVIYEAVDEAGNKTLKEAKIYN